MSDKYKSQGITLLIIGAVLALSFVPIINYPRGNDMASGVAGIMTIMFMTLPAVGSVVCLGLGIGRLVAARRATKQLASGPVMTALVEYRRQASDYRALVIVTWIVGVIGLLMAAVIFYVLFILREVLGFAIFGAVPVALLLMALIIVPLNIRKIKRERSMLEATRQ